MNQKPRVIQTEHLSEEPQQWLDERCELIHCSGDDPEFPKYLADALGLVIRTYTTLDRATLDLAPKLKVIGRAGAGLDNIDLIACKERNIEVVYRPEANTQAVVEYVLMLLGDALRPRMELTAPLDLKTWNTLRAETVGLRQMNELTLGILGLGRVGMRLAHIAQAIGFKVIYNDLVEKPIEARFDAEPVSAEALFASADVISIHIDGRKSNLRFVDKDLIGSMHDDVLLINTSRGFVVDNAALADFLRKHERAEARLDVHDPEPIDADYPLLGLPNAKLYPHLASRTEWAMREMSWVVKDVVAVLEGREPEYPAT